ncbi:MAG TPA: hypothetical protein VI485_14020 [Vicinamibacterales bacterium]|nr:hypothetical protein [Vicinamibacterales bacterium]
MLRLRAGIAVVLALLVVSGAGSLPQRFGVFEGAGAGIRVPPRDFNDGRFTICKWMFRSDRSEPSSPEGYALATNIVLYALTH